MGKKLLYNTRMASKCEIGVHVFKISGITVENTEKNLLEDDEAWWPF